MGKQLQLFKAWEWVVLGAAGRAPAQDAAADQQPHLLWDQLTPKGLQCKGQLRTLTAAYTRREPEDLARLEGSWYE